MKQAKPLTRAELDHISKRIDEIHEVIKLCDPIADADVIKNLQDDLAAIDASLDRAQTAATRAEKLEASGLILFRRTS